MRPASGGLAPERGDGRGRNEEDEVRILTATACLVALAAIFAMSPRAAELPDLYEAEVPVASQEIEDREVALGLALRRVLSKVTGQRNVESHEPLAEALKAPRHFVQQFRYRSAPNEDPDASDGETLWLWAKFDAELVDTLLRESSLTVWGRSRPSTLVWLSVESAEGRDLLAIADGGAYFDSIEEGARRRGIPVVLPLLDLEDRLALNPDELWAGFLDDLRAASARYDTEAILLVRLREFQPTLSEAHWSLLMDSGEQHWTTRSDLPELLLEDGVHMAADFLAARYSRPADRDATGMVDMVVTGVRTLEDYARALGYLDSLEEVERVEVDAVEPGQVRFRVAAHGGRHSIRETVALGSTLSPEGFPGPDGALQLRLLR